MDDTPDQTPDSPPAEADRGSIESVDQSPDARNGAVGGTDGVTRNQDDDAQ